jgi:hypothetical protein
MARRRKPIGPTARSDRFQKLKTLKCFSDAYERICSGWSIPQVARFIQEEKREYLDITRGGLERQLSDFRKTIPASHLVAKRFPQVYEDAKEKIEGGLDELRELEELYKLQMDRITIDHTIEKAIRKLVPSLTTDIREARKTLESIAHIKMELGIHSRAPRGVDVSIGVEGEIEMTGQPAQFGNEMVQRVIESPESRRRVMGVMERFLQLSGEDPKKLPEKIPENTN